MDSHEWFKQAGYGMMVHWGLYTLLGGEYRGRKVKTYAEWAQSYFRIPNAEYGRLAQAFNPVYFNADEWVAFAQDCGMKYLVVTSKHHDGFAMFASRADRYNVADATPFGRDVMAELADACARRGMKLGIYYSQDLDWHEEHGGGYLSNHMDNAGTTWDNSWDFPDEDKKDFSICFEKKIMPQIEEILTGYGELCLVWSRRAYDAQRGAEPRDIRRRQAPSAQLPHQLTAGQRRVRLRVAGRQRDTRQPGRGPERAGRHECDRRTQTVALWALRDRRHAQRHLGFFVF